MAEESHTRFPKYLALLVGLSAYAAYVLTAAGTPYLLDSAELATASFSLGIAHPPGEETALLWGKLFCYLPLGPIAFRVAVGQAVAGALAVVLLYGIVLEIARRLAYPTLPPYLRSLTAAATALAFAFAPGMVLSSNRPEVYALQTLLSLGALFFALRGARQKNPTDFFLALLAVGLGMGNHPLLAGLVGLGVLGLLIFSLPTLPPLLPMALGSLLAFALGLGILAYLPLRAAALFSQSNLDAVLWGDARSFRGFWWVISAATFTQKNALVQGNASPGDLPFVALEELEPPFALIALVGLYVLLRTRATRVTGLGLLLGCLGSMGSALWGGMDPANPDTRGYLAPALAILAAFSGTALLAGIALFRVAKLRLPLTLVFVVGALSRYPSPDAYPSLRHARAAWDTTLNKLDALPPRAALFTHHFETGFLIGYERQVEGRRPDVDRVHLAFAGGPGYAEQVRLAAPQLAEVVDSLQSPNPSIIPFQVLARARPVAIEAAALFPHAIRDGLFPANDFWSPEPGDSTPRSLTDEALKEALADRQVRGTLAFQSYIDAVWACARGIRDRAGVRLADLEKLVPKDLRLLELKTRCLDP